jgi:hypothetical protein
VVVEPHPDMDKRSGAFDNQIKVTSSAIDVASDDSQATFFSSYV